MGMPTPGDQPPRLTLLNAPLPSDEAIGRLFAATLQSSAEVLNMDLSVEPGGDHVDTEPQP